MKAGIIYYLTKSFDFLQIVIEDKSYYFVGDWLKAQQILRNKGIGFFNIQSLDIPVVKALRILCVPSITPEAQNIINEQFQKDINNLVNTSTEEELVMETLCKIEKKV